MVPGLGRAMISIGRCAAMMGAPRGRHPRGPTRPDAGQRGCAGRACRLARRGALGLARWPLGLVGDRCGRRMDLVRVQPVLPRLPLLPILWLSGSLSLSAAGTPAVVQQYAGAAAILVLLRSCQVVLSERSNLSHGLACRAPDPGRARRNTCAASRYAIEIMLLSMKPSGARRCIR